MNQNLIILNSLLGHPDKFNLVNDHHLEGLLFHQFKIENGKNKSQYKKQWIHNHVLLEELENIAIRLKALKLSGTLLKGAQLLTDLYQDTGSRFMSDVDILIDKQNYNDWKELLLSSGYHSLELPIFIGNDFKSQWIKSIGNIEINLELHTKLFFHLKRENWNLTNSAITPFTQLSVEDTFLHLCGHLAFQHTFLKLYWLFDIYFYIEKHGNEMNWDEVKSKSKNYHLYQSICMCLWCLYKYFDLEKSFVEAFKLDQPHWWQKYLTVDFLLCPDEKKIDYFLIKHATKDHLMEAFRYDLTWFLHYKIQKKWHSK